ncbi:hypothetical protein GQ43DRAFT_430830 [Delitschia confertaspora ATCC 74209]|uniref:Uncharacterized protein n=1 Tax=Delitschia confertaspora ATCC 74209 TaxID=1513339 RepID=A0A9P4MTT0_9PLEO|nr:hypothetical protein GQ43DRAFT_430830 [Delitschia confertaspora ATCC 74209]
MSMRVRSLTIVRAIVVISVAIILSVALILIFYLTEVWMHFRRHRWHFFLDPFGVHRYSRLLGSRAIKRLVKIVSSQELFVAVSSVITVVFVQFLDKIFQGQVIPTGSRETQAR